MAILVARLRCFPQPISISIIWKDSTRRDPDNIFAGVKFILDAMVSMRIIPNDSKKYIKGITHRLEEGNEIIVTIDKSF